MKDNTLIKNLSPYGQENVDVNPENDNEFVNTFFREDNVMVDSLPQFNLDHEPPYGEEIAYVVVQYLNHVKDCLVDIGVSTNVANVKDTNTILLQGNFWGKANFEDDSDTHESTSNALVDG